jgi:hypothetical protein
MYQTVINTRKNYKKLGVPLVMGQGRKSCLTKMSFQSQRKANKVIKMSHRRLEIAHLPQKNSLFIQHCIFLKTSVKSGNGYCRRLEKNEY